LAINPKTHRWYKKVSREERQKERHERRLYRREIKQKPRQGKRKYPKINRKRYVTEDVRLLIIEMSRIQSYNQRLIVLEKQLRSLGGFKARSKWGINKDKIIKLHQERNQVQSSISEYKKYAQLKNGYNCNPYYIAKALKLDAAIVYRVQRMFAWTGNVIFCRDRRNHLKPDEAKENPLPREAKAQAANSVENKQALLTKTAMLRARIAPNPCAAPHSEETNSSGLYDTPLARKEGYRNNAVSKRQIDTQAVLAKADFLLNHDYIITNEELLEKEINFNPDDYYRQTTAHYQKVYRGFGKNKKPEIIEDFDCPPDSYTYKQHEMSLGILEKDGMNLTELGMKVYHIDPPKPKEYYEALSARMIAMGF